jgi:SagB-type dehydrogenase family enzyme
MGSITGKAFFILWLPAVLALACSGGGPGAGSSSGTGQDDGMDQSVGAPEIVALPDPAQSGGMPLEEALSLRSSVRSWTDDSLTIEQISQLLWAAQGITHGDGRRSAPSAGMTYPIEVYLATDQRLYHYLPKGHRAEVVEAGGLVGMLGKTAQDFISTAPAVLVITGVYARTEESYGDRAERYVKLEAGHVAQNVLLEAVSLGLGAVPVGAFDDAKLKEILGLPADRDPLYLIPVGHPAE